MFNIIAPVTAHTVFDNKPIEYDGTHDNDSKGYETGTHAGPGDCLTQMNVGDEQPGVHNQATGDTRHCTQTTTFCLFDLAYLYTVTDLCTSTYTTQRPHGSYSHALNISIKKMDANRC